MNVLAISFLRPSTMYRWVNSEVVTVFILAMSSTKSLSSWLEPVDIVFSFFPSGKCFVDEKSKLNCCIKPPLKKAIDYVNKKATVYFGEEVSALLRPVAFVYSILERNFMPTKQHIDLMSDKAVLMSRVRELERENAELKRKLQEFDMKLQDSESKSHRFEKKFRRLKKER